MATKKTGYAEGSELAAEHGWSIVKSVAKAVLVQGHMSTLLNVEVTLERIPSVDAVLTGENTQLIGQGPSIPAAVRAALGLDGDS